MAKSDEKLNAAASGQKGSKMGQKVAQQQLMMRNMQQQMNPAVSQAMAPAAPNPMQNIQSGIASGAGARGFFGRMNPGQSQPFTPQIQQGISSMPGMFPDGRNLPRMQSMGV